MASYPPLEDRPLKNTICLFDVDGTLTPARQVCLLQLLLRCTPLITHLDEQDASWEMIELLRQVRKRVAIGVVGGSDFVKISEQLSINGTNGKPVSAKPLFTG